MGRVKRTGIEGTAITAVVAAVELLTNGDTAGAAVAAAVGIAALVAADHVRLKELGISKETIEEFSTQAGDAVEDAVEGVQNETTTDSNE